MSDTGKHERPEPDAAVDERLVPETEAPTGKHARAEDDSVGADQPGVDVASTADEAVLAADAADDVVPGADPATVGSAIEPELVAGGELREGTHATAENAFREGKIIGVEAEHVDFGDEPDTHDDEHIRFEDGHVEIPPVTGEVAVLARVQRGLGSHPSVVAAARGMSHFGEHALGWVAVAGVGAALDSSRRREWAGVAVGAVGAHAASIVIKRVVRRKRPNHPAVAVNVGTPSKLSFPSSHATSTAAAAVLLGRLLQQRVAPQSRLAGLALPAVLVPPMLLSRLVLGVHYPTDVLAGSALGAASAAAVLAAEGRLQRQ